MSSIYISGPITGKNNYNRAAFCECAKKIKSIGEYIRVVNPADIFLPEGVSPTWENYMKSDIPELLSCENICMLDDWESSKGACLELAIARSLKMGVFFYNSETKEIDSEVGREKKEEKKKPESILEEAQRLVLGDRGKAYGPPSKDFIRVAALWSPILGVTVKAEQVPLCMVALKISRQCNSPKRDNWTDMAGYAQCGAMVDEEAGRI